ncbi:hypothetical protein TKK_0017597 [Trichogramma kaykai]
MGASTTKICPVLVLGQALLQCLVCLLPFLDHDSIDTLAYTISSAIVVVDEDMHQEIINYLCFHIFPFTIGRRTVDESLNYSSQSVSAVIMIIFEYSKSTALAVDEMMVKSHGRSNLQKFMKNKPERWEIKKWGIASPEGYFFDCDIHCVLPRKLDRYQLYFDNFFTNPDLLIHLKTRALKTTGTVRVKRVNAVNNPDENGERAAHIVQHEKNSGLNFITAMDSEDVSVLSTAAGVTPLSDMDKFSFDEMKDIAVPFPHAFKMYNTFMGACD